MTVIAARKYIITYNWMIIQQRLTIRYFNQSPDSGYFAVNRKFQVQLKY